MGWRKAASRTWNSNFANLLFLGIHKFLSKMLILFMVLIDQIRNKVEVAGNLEITLRYPTNFWPHGTTLGKGLETQLNFSSKNGPNWDMVYLTSLVLTLTHYTQVSSSGMGSWCPRAQQMPPSMGNGWMKRSKDVILKLNQNVIFSQLGLMTKSLAL